MIPERKRLKQTVLIGLVMSFLWLAGCAHPPAGISVPGPTLLPHTTRQMQMPGFWVNRSSSPDLALMSHQEIETLNRHIQTTLAASVDLMDESLLQSGAALVSELEKELLKRRSQPFFTASGQAVDLEFLNKIKTLMNIPMIGEKIPVRYGVIVRFADQRTLPTDDPVYGRPGDTDFDELQNSALDLGTAVRILHESRDRRWCYVQSELSGGWVRSEFIAGCDRNEALVWYRPQPFVVTVRAKADVFRNPGLTDYHETVRMGVCLPLINGSGSAVTVKIPLRNASGDLVPGIGYLWVPAVHQGFLPATPRIMIEQAFELHHAPYGWGGMYGEQDCSRFIQEVLATVGIRMPRNSADQARVGHLTASFAESDDTRSRYDILSRSAEGGITLLYMKGHIMLYLGEVDDRHYAIHSTYAFRRPVNSVDQIVRINRVAVSDLSLGQGSARGSLADRLVSMRKLRISND